jgi:hypothetical protein
MENMKSKIIPVISIIILVLLIPLVSAESIVNVAPTPFSTYHKGDSYTTEYFPSEIVPQNGTEQPKIEITNITNNTVLSSNNFTLTFNLILEAPTNHHSYSIYHPITITLQGFCVKPSWQSENITIDFGSNTQFVNQTLPFSVSFTDITDGPNTVTVYASALYEFETGRQNVRQPVSPSGMIVGNFLNVYSNYYFMEGSSSVDFTIDALQTPTPTIISSNPHTAINQNTSFLIVILVSGIAVVTLVLIFRKKHPKIPNQ